MHEKKTNWKELLKESRRLEKDEALPDEALEKLKKDSFAEASKLTKLLSEEWFIHDNDVGSKKAKKKK